MTAGSVVSRVIELMRKRFKMFVAIGVMPLVAELALLIPLFVFFGVAMVRPGGEAFGPSAPEFSVVMVLLLAVAMVGTLFVYALAETAASWAALRLDAGAEATARQAWQVAWQQPGRSCGLLLLRALRYAGPMLVPIVLLVAGSAALAAGHSQEDPAPTAVLLILLAVLLLVGGIVLGLVLYVADALSNAASVTENLSAWPAIRRSVALSRGARWRIFGVGFLLYLMVMALLMAFEIAGVIVFVLGAALFELLHLGEVAAVVGTVLGAAVFLPLFVAYIGVVMTMQPLYQAVIYRDLRRLEPANPVVTHPGGGFTGPQFR
jgi:hypothetical protein